MPDINNHEVNHVTRRVRHDAGTEILGLRRTGEGFLSGLARVTRVGVFPYKNPDGSVRWELRHPEDVFAADSLATLRMIPITDLHPQDGGGLLNPNTAKALTVGYTGEQVTHDGEFVIAPVKITAADGLQAVGCGRQELSLGYTYEREETTGEYQGQHYDFRQRNIRYNHLALVPRGRAGGQVRLHVAADGLETVENYEPSTRSDRMVKISLDGGLTYEVPPEVEVAYKNLKTALDGLTAELTTARAQVSKMTGERDALQASLKVAQDAASEDRLQALVQARVTLERVAHDFLDEETAKSIPTLKRLDLMKLVVKTKLPDVNLDAADVPYVQACFDTVVRLAGTSGSTALDADVTKLQADRFTPGAPNSSDKNRRAMVDRMLKAATSTGK